MIYLKEKVSDRPRKTAVVSVIQKHNTPLVFQYFADRIFINSKGWLRTTCARWTVYHNDVDCHFVLQDTEVSGLICKSYGISYRFNGVVQASGGVEFCIDVIL
jgi:hypothetical protein